MIVISYGLTQVGSTLTFETAKAALELSGHPQPRLADGLVQPEYDVNFVRFWSDELLGNLITATSGEVIVVKTHRIADELSVGAVLDAIDRGEVRIHVTYRDPRDIVASMVDQAVRSRFIPRDDTREPRLEPIMRMLGWQLRELRWWGSFPSLKLQYEHFAFDPLVAPSLIADDLGLDVDRAAVAAIVRERFTQQNVMRPARHIEDLWPHEIERVEAAFPIYLEMCRGRHDLGWFQPVR